MTLHSDEEERFARAIDALAEGVDISPAEQAFATSALVIDTVGA